MERANKSQSHRPRAIPTGTPRMIPTMAATDACQATATAS